MSAAERRAQQERVDDLLLQFEAAVAQRNGIDVFQPGWRDKYLELQATRDAEREEISNLLGTPHVDEAIERMEEQFVGGRDA